MGPRTWWIAAIVGAAMLLLIMLLPTGVALELTWVLVGALTFVATRVGRRLHRLAHRGAYDLLSAAAGVIVVASFLEVSLWAPTPDSLSATVAQVFYLVSFVLFAVGMFRFVAMRMPTGDAEGLIDAGLVAIATAAVLYDVITDPAVADVYSEAGSAALVMLPLLMACVLASIVRVLLTGAHRYLAIWFFLGAALASMVANVLVIAADSEGAIFALRPLFLTGYVLLACAMLHPTVARLCEPAERTGTSLALGRLAVIGAALAALPAIMLRNPTEGVSRVPALAAILCVGLVVWRIARLLRDRERAAEALERRAEREAALSSVGRAAVTAVDPTAFVRQLTEATDHALDVRSSLTSPDPDDTGDATRLVAQLGGTLGALEARFPGDRPASDDDRRFLRTAADLAAAALRRWEVEEQLRHRSLHDHLTGLPNRALVTDRLERAILRGAAAGTQLVVLFIDLDGFKQVNDTLGHAAGDEVLGEVAQRLLADVRPRDLVGRLAGDEFVVVCEDAPTDTATVLAHRLLDAMTIPFELDLGDATIGASIGVACAEPGDDPETLLHRADAAMYHAKNAGKGRVTLWPGHATASA